MAPANRPAPSPLAQRIAQMIEACGPISVDAFMAQALYDPDMGYYTRVQPLGAQGDFTTSPEISQMFGELIGLWVAQSWLDLGSPAPFKLIELGPGRGTLLADMLRVFAKVPGLLAALHLHLVETNPVLRQLQKQAVGAQLAQWHDRLEDVPHGPGIVIGNEFLDCLPIRQYVRTEQGWHDKLVGLDGNKRLSFGLSPVLTNPPDVARPDDPIGAVREMAPGLQAVVEALADRLKAHPGRALLIDYGDVSGRPGDSLQAVLAHQKVHPLDHIGRADLTAHVDFAALTALARHAGVGVLGPVTQRDFLIGLGIIARRDALIRANPHCESDMTLSVERLIGEAHMGGLFHVVALESSLNAADGPPIGL